MGVVVNGRGEDIHLEGEAESVRRAEALLRQMAELMAEGHAFTKGDFKSAVRLMLAGADLSLRDFLVESKISVSPSRTVLPKSLNQQRYVRAIQSHDIAFGVGPAGTGKTYLAVASAVAALNQGRVRRIVLARPAVEAGERLGFLPGTLVEKVDPYLRPLYDALYDLLGAHRLHARPHPERRLHHPRRGAEHHERADEDVRHAPWVQLEGRRHRRRHAD
jgi:phosphate starvation-inducible PhoH-like protein